jgi:hypothetical protein
VASLLEQDIFNLPKTKRSIHELAEVDSLVLFVGAGLPASQGLPGWNQLLRNLVGKAASAHRALTDDEAREEFVQTLLRTTDPTILGSIIRGLYRGPEAFVDAMRKAIYSDQIRRGPRPASNFCRAVWELIFTRRASGLETLVVTTNYDDGLETSLESDLNLRSLAQSLGVSFPLSVHSESQYASLRDETPDDAVLVHHIHGFIPVDTTVKVEASDVVLSAHDYGRNWESHWSYQLLSSRWDSQWLFVGMSFHDPHISFFLRARHERLGIDAASADARYPPRGVFSLQGQPWARLSESARLGLARAEITRLQELGMKPLPTLYFFQDAQFLREIALRTRVGSDEYVAYVDRRGAWSEAFAEARLSSDGDVQAEGFLESIHLMLFKLRAQIEALSSDEDEMFKVELWCRDTDERCLYQIGSSEYVTGSPERARRHYLDTNLPIAAVQALTAGAPIRSSIPISEASRWHHYLAVPVFLDEQPWHDLPVGALVMASSAPEAASTLHTQQADIEAQLEQWVALVMPFFDPYSEIDILREFSAFD